MIEATVVNKEDIIGLKFVSIDQPHKATFRQDLRAELERALKLGNTEHQKVKIIFETDTGTRFADTTIWNLTENYVILKGNIDIPIRSIHRIEFFE